MSGSGILRETTVAASLVIDLVGHLARRGLSEAEICRAARIDLAVLDAPDDRVPGGAMERLWQVGESLAKDPDLGLHAAESHRPGALNILGYVVQNCATAREVIEKLVRYAVLIHDGLRASLSREGTDTLCGFEAIAGLDNYLLRSPRQAMETTAAGLTCTLSALTHGAVRPREVSFRHAAPAVVGEHTRVFGVAPRFRQPLDRVVFWTPDLQHPIRSANPSLLAMFERHAVELLAHLEAHGPVGRRVLEVLAKRISGAAPPLGEVASALAMSARNLQRALREEETSYQALLDHARRELALRHLATPEGSAAEVAFLLGFADASAFTRAFRRWTGRTPGAFRASRRAGTAATPAR
jgi:AraC-like DNA-binding protein